MTLLATPIVWVSKGVEVWDVFDIRSDIKKCLDTVDSQNSLLPQSFIVSLIAAEDHRNAIHPGVDPIAILRAIYVRCRRGDLQGASTIEQQFVRVVSGRYERTLCRKLYEQLLAVCVSRRRTKTQIASTYLSIAYYGSDVNGITGLWAKLGSDLSVVGMSSIREMIARLKYPEPLLPTATWRRKVQARVTYIKRREAWLRGKWYEMYKREHCPSTID